MTLESVDPVSVNLIDHKCWDHNERPLNRKKNVQKQL